MKTIAIAGSQSRIGTTTQALQMVLCLQNLEYETAYIEMGNQGYLSGIRNLYEDIIENKKTGSLIFRDIELFSDKNIIEANKRGCDYIIKDYGSINSPQFEKISYLEQDIKIIVGGVKANEIENVEKVLAEKCYEDVKYIFSFVSQEEQQDIRMLMGEHKENTYFAVYTPDPFSFSHADIYEYLLGGG